MYGATIRWEFFLIRSKTPSQAFSNSPGVSIRLIFGADG